MQSTLLHEIDTELHHRTVALNMAIVDQILHTVEQAVSLPSAHVLRQHPHRLSRQRQLLRQFPRRLPHPHPPGLQLVLTERVVEQLATHVKDQPMGYTCNLSFCVKHILNYTTGLLLPVWLLWQRRRALWHRLSACLRHMSCINILINSNANANSYANFLIDSHANTNFYGNPLTHTHRAYS